jgi:hypothetical protein
MSSRRFGSPAVRLLLPVALLSFGACQSQGSKAATPSAAPGKPVEISNEYESTAKVVAVAPEVRGLTLRREDGVLAEVRVGPEVRNYDQIAVGDTVRARYKETLAAALYPPGTPPKPAQAAFVSASAPKGAKPGAGAGVAVSTRVKVLSIDLGQDLVVLALPSGELLARKIRTPQGREFVKTLKVGDVVGLDYSESVALSVEKL